jgi:hypothetical protein
MLGSNWFDAPADAPSKDVVILERTWEHHLVHFVWSPYERFSLDCRTGFTEPAWTGAIEVYPTEPGKGRDSAAVMREAFGEPQATRSAKRVTR